MELIEPTLSNIYPSNIKLASEEKQLQKTLYLWK